MLMVFLPGGSPLPASVRHCQQGIAAQGQFTQCTRARSSSVKTAEVAS